MAGALIQSGQVPLDAVAGRQLMALPVQGRDRPTGTDRAAAGLPADGLTPCLAASIGHITLLIT